MSDINTTEVHSRTLTAFFDTRGAAEQAIHDLEAAGIPRQQIRRVDDGTSARPSGTDEGFWESLKNMFLPPEDSYGYAEGLRRGGFMIAVTADEANYSRVLNILDRDGAIDMDEREASWRREGWTGYQAGGAATEATLTSSPSTAAVTQSRGTSASAGVSSGIGAAAEETSSARTVEAGGEEVIPIYEEELRVGKRDVSHGRVRLRSYVTKTPVSEQVSLHEERVSVERRPVDRSVSGVTGDPFRERVIEVEERAEEALVSKDVRVKEEIALRKEAAERTETVSDTVRRTEVDVQDDRGRIVAGAAAVGTSASSFAGRIAEHMDVIASDGVKIGTVDHLEGTDRIKLSRSASLDGQHHFIPLAWVDHVDQHVHLNRAAEAAKAGW